MKQKMEIERKWWFKGDVEEFLEECEIIKTMPIYQKYLSMGEHEIRIRLEQEEVLVVYKEGFGLTRNELIFKTTMEDYHEKMALFGGTKVNSLSKVRYNVIYHSEEYEVDVFDDRSLVLIEKEFESVVDAESFVGAIEDIAEEVTGNYDFYNANLVNKYDKEFLI
jgi:CYTH domain-containing protein